MLGLRQWCGAAVADGLLEPDRSHDPRDPLVVDHRAALVTELGGDPWGPVGAVGVLVNLAYPGCLAALAAAVRRQ